MAAPGGVADACRCRFVEPASDAPNMLTQWCCWSVLPTVAKGCGLFVLLLEALDQAASLDLAPIRWAASRSCYKDMLRLRITSPEWVLVLRSCAAAWLRG